MSFTITCLHVKLRMYEAMDGKSHDMVFVLTFKFDNGTSRQRTKHIHKMLALGGVKIYKLA